MSLPNKGIGVIATSNISNGQLLLAEPPLIQIIRAETDETDLSAVVDALPETERLAYHALCAADETCSEDWSILETNGFNLRSDSSRTGVYARISRFNHSCTPNAAHQCVYPSC